jgi:hypothetical protein
MDTSPTARVSQSMRASQNARVSQNAREYGACPTPGRRGSIDEGGAGYLSEPEDRGCNTLSFRRFSRSVRLASQLGRTLQQEAAAEAAAAADVVSELLEPPRHWHSTSNDVVGLLELLRESAILLCLLFVSSVLAIASTILHWGAPAIFGLNFLAMVPLAILLGDLTEALSGWCGPTAGGLLNATLGNMTEGIVLVQARPPSRRGGCMELCPTRAHAHASQIGRTRGSADKKPTHATRRRCATGWWAWSRRLCSAAFFRTCCSWSVSPSSRAAWPRARRSSSTAA